MHLDIPKRDTEQCQNGRRIILPFKKFSRLSVINVRTYFCGRYSHRDAKNYVNYTTLNKTEEVSIQTAKTTTNA